MYYKWKIIRYLTISIIESFKIILLIQLLLYRCKIFEYLPYFTCLRLLLFEPCETRMTILAPRRVQLQNSVKVHIGKHDGEEFNESSQFGSALYDNGVVI